MRNTHVVSRARSRLRMCTPVTQTRTLYTCKCVYSWVSSCPCVFSTHGYRETASNPKRERERKWKRVHSVRWQRGSDWRGAMPRIANQILPSKLISRTTHIQHPITSQSEVELLINPIYTDYINTIRVYVTADPGETFAQLFTPYEAIWPENRVLRYCGWSVLFAAIFDNPARTGWETSYSFFYASPRQNYFHDY